MKILVTRRINKKAIGLLKSRFEVDYIAENKPLARKFLLSNLRKYDGVLSCVSEIFDAEVLSSAAAKLKAISNMAVGLDNIDLRKAKELGIRVFNTPGIVTDSTADMTIALGLSLVRNIPNASLYVKNKEWKGWDPEVFVGRTIQGLLWGIIGFGAIGQAVAKRIYGFGPKIIFYDPFKDVESIGNSISVKKVDLDELLGKADIISIHVPLEKETIDLISHEQFKKMKKRPYLINMARGKIIDTEALVEAMKSRKISGAALDVFDPEPLNEAHEILSFNNIILTPHIGTATKECRKQMAICAAENLIAFLGRQL